MTRPVKKHKPRLKVQPSPVTVTRVDGSMETHRAYSPAQAKKVIEAGQARRGRQRKTV